MPSFTESVVEDTALAGLNPDLPAGILDNPYQLTFPSLRAALLPKPISDKLQMKDAERFIERHV